MTKILTIEKCTDCPMFKLLDVGEQIVQLFCYRMMISEIVRGGSAQKEIDILNGWFYGLCDLPDAYSQAEEK